MGTVWYVYLISTGKRTYIGSSTDVRRRLRQHNGEIVGGARSTAPFHGQWYMVCYISGFDGRSSACRWEKLVKSRARGFENRVKAMTMVADGECPPYKKRAQYPVPSGLRLVTKSVDTNEVWED